MSLSLFSECLLQVNQSLKGKTEELRGELEGEQEKVRPVREEADALRNKVRLSIVLMVYFGVSNSPSISCIYDPLVDVAAYTPLFA